MCEVAKVYSHKLRKARKDHICRECRGIIKRGEQYHYHSGIWDDPDDFKVCLECEALRKDVDRNVDYDDRTPFEGLCESVFNIDDLGFMTRFVAIKEQRGAEVKDWMRMKLDAHGKLKSYEAS